MKQLTVISGKGGTGKTTLTASFAALANRAVLADCDVDAADLHLILDPEVIETRSFKGLQVASKIDDRCIDCGKCLEHCRFEAIDAEYDIIAEKCEGCGVCAFVCPTDALSLVDRESGYAYTSHTRFGPMSHARLFTAEEASGKLVAEVRNDARALAEDEKRELVIIDGPPGIGCPVIAAITGVDQVLVVTEPTVSGIHDLERVLGVAEHFGIPAMVCINKYDINEKRAKMIEDLCRDRGVTFAGLIPYDESAVSAMVARKSVVEHSDGVLSESIKAVWERVCARLEIPSP